VRQPSDEARSRLITLDVDGRADSFPHHESGPLIVEALRACARQAARCAPDDRRARRSMVVGISLNGGRPITLLLHALKSCPHNLQDRNSGPRIKDLGKKAGAVPHHRQPRSTPTEYCLESSAISFLINEREPGFWRPELLSPQAVEKGAPSQRMCDERGPDPWIEWMAASRLATPGR